jgi:hypothetical protein
MTERNATANARQKQIPFGDDNKKGSSKSKKAAAKAKAAR